MKDNLARRRFLTYAAIGAGSTLAGLKTTEAADVSFVTNFKPSEKPFVDQYYDGMLSIAEHIRDTQTSQISKAMETAYELMRKGGKVYSQVIYGHFAMFMGSRDLPGQPNVLPQSGIRPGPSDFEAMKPGDFLLTNCVNEETLKVKEKGVFVTGIINSYNKFSRTAPEGLRPERMKISTEDVSNLVIDSGVSWDNGLVNALQIPKLKLCPSTGTANALVYWACTAALATLIGTKGKGSAEEAAKKYLSDACDRFRMIGTDRPKIDEETGLWADLVLSKKARLLVYGHPQDVEPYEGAKNMFTNEAYIVASGTMIADLYDNKVSELRSSDIVLIGAFTPDNSLEVNVARYSGNAGAHTVAFCPYGAGTGDNKPRLFREVDTAFNTYCDEPGGFISVKGFSEPVSPLTGVTGNMLHWMLMASWTDHMCHRGEPPYYWKGYHENGGREYGEEANKKFILRGY